MFNLAPQGAAAADPCAGSAGRGDPTGEPPVS